MSLGRSCSLRVATYKCLSMFSFQEKNCSKLCSRRSLRWWIIGVSWDSQAEEIITTVGETSPDRPSLERCSSLSDWVLLFADENLLHQGSLNSTLPSSYRPQTLSILSIAESRSARSSDQPKRKTEFSKLAWCGFPGVRRIGLQCFEGTRHWAGQFRFRAWMREGGWRLQSAIMMVEIYWVSIKTQWIDPPLCFSLDPLVIVTWLGANTQDEHLGELTLLLR